MLNKLKKNIVQFIKCILRTLGYAKIAQFFQNIFRTRFATDMYLSQCNVVTETHKQTFGKYKNKYHGQDIAIIATGPSLNKYKPIGNTINIGVNKAIFYDKVNLDYFFAIDYLATKDYLKDLKNFPNIDKFYGILPKTAFGYKRNLTVPQIIPESFILEQNAKKYYVYQKMPLNPVSFNTDIDKTWIVDGGSCIFSAVQFALFTNPRRIYIVGCDCSTGYFDEKNPIIKPNKQLVKTWKELQEFADIYYPETEIISVNPVGLKGIFTDLYQDEEDKLG